MEWFYAESDNQPHSVKEAELENLINTGVVSSTTLVWNESLPNWIPAGEALGNKWQGVEAAPPRLTASQVKQAITAVPGSSGQRSADDAVAICAIVFGLLGVFTCIPFLSLAGVICGHIGRKRARLETAPSSNGGLALGGIIAGYIGLVLFLIFVLIYGAISIAVIASGGLES